VIEVAVDHGNVELPLGWALSAEARRDLHDQVRRYLPENARGTAGLAALEEAVGPCDYASQ